MTKQSEEPKYQLVALKDATHIKINGVIREITRFCPDSSVFSHYTLRRQIQDNLHEDEVRILIFPSLYSSIGILKGKEAFDYLNEEMFSIFGIECLKEVPPLGYEKTVVSLDHNNEGVILYLPKEAIGKKFRLIEIRDEE